jgi:F-type H+-transporting ATPase subunit c
MTNLAFSYLSAGFGAGLSVIGVGIGIGRLAASALDATGRQPASTGDLRTTMLIAAALIEGVGLFGLVLSILLATKA